jgi:hypothetical protein
MEVNTMVEHKVPLQQFKDARIEAKEGVKVTLQAGGDKMINAVVVKVEKDTVTLKEQ